MCVENAGQYMDATMMKIDYDKNADVLYITLEHTLPPVTFHENERGQIIRTNEKNKVIGVTIPMFSRRASENEIVIDEI